ncbi:MAG: hypothetical protein QG608_2336 [Actinomycetota bacterium]|nr:hypothetical protein [Actinomycetota bacterium]
MTAVALPVGPSSRPPRHSSCFFRTPDPGDGRKALVQITDRCNLHCAHCSVSAGARGDDLSADSFRDIVLPRLREAGVTRVTLTGGEPFLHPDLLQICRDLRTAGLPIGICTNGTSTGDDDIEALRGLGGIHVTVSLDGFRAGSHGKFRGLRSSFEVTIATVRALGEAGLLRGLVCTPNTLCEKSEFAELCDFALESGAGHVLMNSLASFGRGVKSRRPLAAQEEMLREIVRSTARQAAEGLEMLYVRFPVGAGQQDHVPDRCSAGRLVSVLPDGTTSVCPYLIYAARTPSSLYSPAQFTAGNILHGTVAAALDRIETWLDDRVGRPAPSSACAACPLAPDCGGGCPAAVIADGGRLGDPDLQQCPPAAAPFPATGHEAVFNRRQALCGTR